LNPNRWLDASSKTDASNMLCTQGEPDLQFFRNPCHRLQKERRAMELSPETAATPLQANDDRRERSSRPADLAYQVVTIVAMILLLGTICAF